MEDIDGSADKEEEDVVVTDVVDSRVDVGTEEVDDVEETGADRRESSMQLRLGYASVEGGKRVEDERVSWLEENENG